jgi:F0F1-type ATP synthase assembly protein I
MRSGDGSDPEHAERLAALSLAVEAAKRERAKENAPKKSVSGNAAHAAIDFASASAVGCALGYGLDLWINTHPWGLVGGLIIGCLAGAKLMMEAEARELRKKASASETTSE